VRGWLFTILRNIWLNDLRHQRASPKIAELASDETLADVSVATSGDPHSHYVSKMERERVRAAIRQEEARPSLTRASDQCTGRFLLDDDVLAERGCRDFEKYAITRGAALIKDLFVM
jgi:DNA-directed RNA polymerase specialized sigma24 family protein